MTHMRSCGIGLPFALFFFVTSVLNAQELKSTPGFDAGAIDKSANPCENFYQYSCGTWMKNNPIPSDQATWGRFQELHERNQTILRQILDRASAAESNRNAVDRKIGDYYATCMDEAAIEKKGLSPLEPELKRIAGLKTRADLDEEIARLHESGVNVLFSFGATQDFKDSSEVIAAADQGGMGLPDRDYYLKTDAKSVETRAKFIAHVQKMFELVGEPADKAAGDAATVMRIETALAKAAFDNVTRRDPQKVYHRLTKAELTALAPSFQWQRYFTDIGTGQLASLDVTEPEFFKGVESLLKNTPVFDWKPYLIWHFLHAKAALLPAKFLNENFDFYGKTLTGAKELRPRWKRCVDYTDGDLGEALGQAYVEKTFGAEGKAHTLRMVHQLEDALATDIQGLDWMTPETKVKALEKLHGITNKIGYPEKWRDYSALKVVRGDALGNSDRANEFEFKRQLAKIGKPVDRLEWGMSPPTVNAYYDPQMNNINFPAGILQPPFYDSKLDDAVNFGGVGAVIGHELTHGFDDEGRQFDAKGNLSDWWTPKDADAFLTRSACIVDEYSGFTAVDDVKLNGKLTLGENAADNGGLRIAYMALMKDLAGKSTSEIDGFTPAQRFFLGWGQVWCTNIRDEAKRLQAQTNPHSLAQYRVNGSVQNMSEFASAFGCNAGQPMVSQKACRVW